MTTRKAELTRADINLMVDALEDSATQSEARAVEHDRTRMELQASMARQRASEKRALVDRLLALRDSPASEHV